MFNKNYKYGFSTKIKSETFPKGISENIIKAISKKKNEPKFLLDFRLNAYNIWKNKTIPTWVDFDANPIDFQDISYYSEPKLEKKLKNLEDADPVILDTLNKLGIPINEQKKLLDVSIDFVLDSTSVGKTFNKKLEKLGVVFCSISEAAKKYDVILKKYLGSVVPSKDNFYSALNSAVFSDGSFVYIPKGVRCPVDISSYFRINEKENGQFERTLIIAEEDSYVSYLEGCSAPSFSKGQMHAAVVELVALKNAEIKYSTVQNWYSGDKDKGGVYNFVTKRGKCLGENSKISWTQVELGSKITWKYPSCILVGDNSCGEFYSVSLTTGNMIADTGSKMIHLGKNTKSTILSKGISSDKSHNKYRGLVYVDKDATDSKNYTKCDSMLIGDTSCAETIPTIDVNNDSEISHEASTFKITEEQLFYIRSKGFSLEDAISFIINGFSKDIIKNLPLEFAAEAKKMLSLKLEQSIG